MIPALHDFAWVVASSSGGKDSQTALRRVLEAAAAQDYPRERIVVSHQLLKRVEWPGTTELVMRQAAHHDLRVETAAYRNRLGQELSLLDMVRSRGMWPSNQQRYCTSELKRGPGLTVLTRLSRERPGDILQVFGFRHQESPARAKKHWLVPNPRASNGKRKVMDWHPILGMTTDEVWQDIRDSGVESHHAYELGMTRLSCALCIFAPTCALVTAGRHNRELLDEYIEVERVTGHTFQNNKPLTHVRELIDSGAAVAQDDREWNM